VATATVTAVTAITAAAAKVLLTYSREPGDFDELAEVSGFFSFLGQLPSKKGDSTFDEAPGRRAGDRQLATSV